MTTWSMNSDENKRNFYVLYFVIASLLWPSLNLKVHQSHVKRKNYFNFYFDEIFLGRLGCLINRIWKNGPNLLVSNWNSNFTTTVFCNEQNALLRTTYWKESVIIGPGSFLFLTKRGSPEYSWNWKSWHGRPLIRSPKWAEKCS